MNDCATPMHTMNTMKAYDICFCNGFARWSGGDSDKSVSVGSARMRCRWPYTNQSVGASHGAIMCVKRLASRACWATGYSGEGRLLVAAAPPSCSGSCGRMRGARMANAEDATMHMQVRGAAMAERRGPRGCDQAFR
eukprot:scaffold125867_cov63-Phaeocystis_antarctica.AAC.4